MAGPALSCLVLSEASPQGVQLVAARSPVLLPPSGPCLQHELINIHKVITEYVHTHTQLHNETGMVITNLQTRGLRQRKTGEPGFNVYFLDSKPNVLSAKPHCFAGLPALINSFTSSCLGLGVL